MTATSLPLIEVALSDEDDLDPDEWNDDDLMKAAISRASGEPETVAPCPSATTPLICVTHEILTISGRGTVHLIHNPVETESLAIFHQRPVRLDGRLVKIARVEGFCKGGVFGRGDRLGLVLVPDKPPASAPMTESRTPTTDSI